MRPIKWSYGVITVPERKLSTLPATLKCLELAGFPNPRLFVDGHSLLSYKDVGCATLIRDPKVGVYANWVLSMYELYLREPTANYFALFQDDILACANIRQYVEATAPGDCYLNLYTFPENEVLAPKTNDGQVAKGWYPAGYANDGWVYQTARGAQGLIIPKQGVIDLLGSHVLADRVQDKHNGWRSVDSVIGAALNTNGWKEYVHYPSLLQHTGKTCTFNKRPNAVFRDENYAPFQWHETTFSQSFPGEQFDAMSLIQPKR